MSTKENYDQFVELVERLKDEELIIGYGSRPGAEGILAGIMTENEKRVRVYIKRTGFFVNRRKVNNLESALRAEIEKSNN